MEEGEGATEDCGGETEGATRIEEAGSRGREGEEGCSGSLSLQTC